MNNVKIFLCSLLFASSSLAAPPQVTSATVETNEAEAVVRINGNYDGSQGVLFLSATIRRGDGTTLTQRRETPGIAVVGNFSLPIRIETPRDGFADASTISVLVFARSEDNIVLRKEFPWAVPATAKLPDARFAPDGPIPASNIQPALDIRDMFSEGRFGDLEKLATAWLDHTKIDRYGHPLAANMLEGFTYIATTANTAQTESSRLAWQKAFPKSVLPTYLKASLIMASASEIVSRRPDHTDNPIVVKAYMERMKAADAILLKNQPPVGSPIQTLWHEMRLRIAVATNRSQATLDAIFDKGTKAVPGYWPLYKLRVDDLTGSLKPNDSGTEISSKVRLVVAQFERDSKYLYGRGGAAYLYARIENGRGLEFDVLRNGMTEWGAIRAGFKDFTDRYPTEQAFNYFASFACRANDRDAYLSARARLKGQLKKEYFRSNASPILCDSRFLKSS